MLSEVQIQELDRLHQHGYLTPAAVVEAARPSGSPLHNLFEWDNEKAAEAYRLDQAREIVRSVKYEFTVRHVNISAPHYVHDPSLGNGQGYVAIESVRSDPSKAWQATRREINSSLGALKRARTVSLALSDEGTISRTLEGIIMELEGLRSASDMQIEGAA